MYRENTRRAILALLLPILSHTVALANSAPQVTSVVAMQRVGTHLVDITYDTYDADGDALTITVFLSTDGGVTYPLQCNSVTGDVGDGVTPGTGLAIVWDAGADLPGFAGDLCSIRVVADDNYVPPSVPVDLFLLLDRSGSMDFYWNLYTNQLNQFFDDAGSDGFSAALSFFPPPSGNACDPVSYDPTHVALGQLPAHAAVLATALAATTPTGLAPTYPAMQGTLAAAGARATAEPTRTVAVVLLTDGAANQCTITSFSEIATIAGNALSAFGVRTYAVGLQGSSASDLDLVAAQGGTTSSWFAGTGIDELLQVMRQIRDDAAAIVPKD